MAVLLQPGFELSDAQRAESYCVRSVPAGFASMFGAGLLSGLLGIGSGAFKVLSMDHIMRLPFKVSATTSNFMIGVTAAAGAGIYLRDGFVAPGLAMPVIVGTLARLDGRHARPAEKRSEMAARDLQRRDHDPGRGNDLRRHHREALMSAAGWTDEKVDRIIGAILQGGVIVAGTLVLAGGILYLIHNGMAVANYRVFGAEPVRNSRHLADPLRSRASGRPRRHSARHPGAGRHARDSCPVLGVCLLGATRPPLCPHNTGCVWPSCCTVFSAVGIDHSVIMKLRRRELPRGSHRQSGSSAKAARKASWLRDSQVFKCDAIPLESGCCVPGAVCLTSLVFSLIAHSLDVLSNIRPFVFMHLRIATLCNPFICTTLRKTPGWGYPLFRHTLRSAAYGPC